MPRLYCNSSKRFSVTCPSAAAGSTRSPSLLGSPSGRCHAGSVRARHLVRASTRTTPTSLDACAPPTRSTRSPTPGCRARAGRHRPSTTPLRARYEHAQANVRASTRAARYGFVVEDERAIWVVKYDGRCAGCGTPLAKGEPAVWDRGTRTMRCLPCADHQAPGPVAAAPLAPTPPPLDVGIPGGSARHEYERRMAKREAVVRGRWGDRLGRVVLALTLEPQSTRAWAQGSLGERRLAASLAKLEGVIALHDRKVHGTRGNVDHIVVAPSGVFVIDAKRFAGRLHIRTMGPFWRSEPRLYAGGRDISSAADGMRWQVDAVKAALVGGSIGVPPPVTPVLCFVDGDWPLFGGPRFFRGVQIDRPSTLQVRFAGQASYTAEQVVGVARILAAAFPANAS